MPNLGRERRWDRGSLLTLAFVISFALISATVAVLVLRQPSEGCIVADASGFSRTLLACYGERPTPLRPSDELVAAGAVSLVLEQDAAWGSPPLPQGWGAGATIDYTCPAGRLCSLHL